MSKQLREAVKGELRHRSGVAEGYPIVRGECPMGCGKTLFLGEGGYVTCSSLRCPAPTAKHHQM